MNESPLLLSHDILKVIRKYQRFLVATHVRPDGDAVGSLLGMTHILRKLGKTADPYCQDPVPAAQMFLRGSNEVRHRVGASAHYDAAVLVDCGGLLRVGDTLADSIRRIPILINIDHHMNEAPFGDVFWVNTSASSTCEMLYDICISLPLRLDPDIAAQLYTGLLTDTGSFRFSNTNQRVLEIAADLVAAGAQPAVIAEQVYDSTSPQSVQLLAKVLTSIRFFAAHRLATALLTQQMFEQTGTTPSDSEGFINHLRSIKTVEMAMLFREDKEGVVHVSIRSKGQVDVACFAQLHGGGGHRNAAAFRIRGSLEAVHSRFAQEAVDYLPVHNG
jgi:bifunctional oligoribonuclease and PAP phosphatase NrnA